MLEGASLYNYLIGVVLILFRTAAFWMFFPIFSERSVPNLVKMVGAFALSICLYPAVISKLPQWTLTSLPDNYEIFIFVFREVLIGIIMGLICRISIFSISSSAQWISIQLGLSLAQAIDPNTNSDNAGWGEFHRWVAIMFFLAIGGQYFLLQALIDSYQFDYSKFFTVLSLSNKSGLFWLEVISEFGVWVLKLSAPLVIVLLAIQMALGVLSKFIPQINIWSVSVPITIGVGILTFTFLSPMYGDVLKEIFSADRNILYSWLKMMGAR